MGEDDYYEEPTRRERRHLRQIARRHQRHLRRQIGRKRYRQIRRSNPDMVPVEIVDTGQLRYLVMSGLPGAQ